LRLGDAAVVEVAPLSGIAQEIATVRGTLAASGRAALQIV
jgi:hypothetical protein